MPIEQYIDHVIHADSAELLKQFPDECVDLVVTSPPYDDLRDYDGNVRWNAEVFRTIAAELYRVVKKGGVVVWVVGDKIEKGSKSLTSFKQALFFREIGFDIEAFGDTSVRVSAVPAELLGIDLDGFFRDVLSSMESLRAIKLTDLLRDKLATAACKAAVKGGESLTEQEVRTLIERMNGDMAMKCPHGRPAVVVMKKSEIEKLFKRIV